MKWRTLAKVVRNEIEAYESKLILSRTKQMHLQYLGLLSEFPQYRVNLVHELPAS